MRIESNISVEHCGQATPRLLPVRTDLKQMQSKQDCLSDPTIHSESKKQILAAAYEKQEHANRTILNMLIYYFLCQQMTATHHSSPENQTN